MGLSNMGDFLGHLFAFAFLSASLYFVFFIPLLRIVRAKGWLATPCVILSSAVNEDRNDSGLYRIGVTYKYEIGGHSFESRRYAFATGAFFGYRGKKAVANRLAPGTKTVCYVNPADPSDSVIERGMTSDLLIVGIVIIIMLISLVFLFGLEIA